MLSVIYFKSFDIKDILIFLDVLSEWEFTQMDLDAEDLDYYDIPIDYSLIRKTLVGDKKPHFRLKMLNETWFCCFVKKNMFICNDSEEKDRMFPLVLNMDLSGLKYIARDISNYDIFRSDMAIKINYWKRKNIPIPEPMVYIPEFSFTDPNYKVLSLEHIPSHAHRMTGKKSDQLIFEAAWQMYFGEIYYKYIPKPLFDDFDDCEENVILEHGIRRITLYKDPKDFGTPHATARQWSFRRRLGIDSIGHELTYNLNRVEPADLPVLITKKDCLKGSTRVTRFLDRAGKLVPPPQAVQTEIKEYLDDGVTVVFEEIKQVTPR